MNHIKNYLESQTVIKKINTREKISEPRIKFKALERRGLGEFVKIRDRSRQDTEL